MKRYLLVIIITSNVFFSNIIEAAISTMQTNYTLPMYSQVYDDTRDPFKDAQAAIKLAKKTNRNIIIEIGGNWCSWCHKMDRFLADNPVIYQQLHNQFVLLKINVSDSNDNKAFMGSLPPVQGYPHMYVASYYGEILVSKDTAQLLVNLEYSTVQWKKFLDKWQVSDNVVTKDK